MCKDFYKEIKYKSCFSKLLQISYLNKLLKSKSLIVKLAVLIFWWTFLYSIRCSLRWLKMWFLSVLWAICKSSLCLWMKQMAVAQQYNVKCYNTEVLFPKGSVLNRFMHCDRKRQIFHLLIDSPDYQNDPRPGWSQEPRSTSTSPKYLGCHPLLSQVH